MLGFGIATALLGAILPVISARLHFDLGRAGILFLVMNAATLVTSFVLGPLLDRFGTKPSLLVAPVVVAASLALVATAASFSMLLPAVALLGAGAGALNQSANTLVAGLHQEPARRNAALNLLGGFFGFGALFVPLTIGALLATLDLANILYLAAAVTLLTTAVSIVLDFPDSHTPKARAPLGFQPLVALLAAMLLFESGNEFILSGFITTRLTRDLGAKMATASYLLAGYWTAIMLMRIALSRILLRVSGERVIMASAAGVAASTALLISAPSVPMAGAAVVLAGLSISAIFPTTLGIAAARYPDQAGTVFGVIIGTSLAGGMTMPWAAGRLSESYGLATGLGLVLVNALAIFAIQWIASKRNGG